jgi:ribosomal protein S18 acetylase RimI-like enzyme
MPATISLRPIAAEDQPFLYQVYASTRQDELAPVPWTDEQKEAFLRMQFAAQHSHYQQHYADASFDVILWDDRPAGRLYVERRDRELRIVDIALLPAYRNRGIGSRLLNELIAEANAAGKPVSIHVEHNNPALRLYQRLGFQQRDTHGVYLLMERPVSVVMRDA